MISDDNYSIVLDPYKGVNGFKDIDVEANDVICSHLHLDHAYTDGVKLTKKDNPFKITTIKTFHDDKNGTLRGENNIVILESNNKRVAHLGDLGHILSDDIIGKLKGIDLLMIPIGGYYTIGPDIACKIIEDVNPKLIIPMHYKDNDKGLDVLKTVDDFLKLYKDDKDKLKLIKGYGKEIEI